MAELHLYDFDSTLFRSPHPPAVWDGGWWGDGRSLTLPCVPDQPGDSWWIMPTVNRAKKSIADPNAFAVMMTLEAQVEEGIKTLSCFHLQSAEARELADCPGSS